MSNIRVLVRVSVTAVVTGLVLGLVFPSFLWAQAALENPQPGSFQSGIGLISGWVCTATRVEFTIDGGASLPAAYGTSRADTRAVCSDDGNNGFGLLFNWNLLTDGVHTLRALRDGVEFARATFTVATLGLGEFPRGLSGAYRLPDFPQAGRNTLIQWQESQQNFVIVGATGTGGGGQVCTPNSTQACTTSQGCPGQKVCNSSGTGFGSCNDTPGDNCPSTGRCDPSYPTVCIPPPPPDLDCGDIPYRNFTVLPPDPHRFDGDGDGIGCEQ